MATRKNSQLHDAAADIKLRLAAAWASVTLCYIYCDYFELYQPGKLQSVLAGRMGPLGESTQGVLLGVSILLSVPALMVFASVALPAKLNRALNLVFARSSRSSCLSSCSRPVSGSITGTLQQSRLHSHVAQCGRLGIGPNSK